MNRLPRIKKTAGVASAIVVATLLGDSVAPVNGSGYYGPSTYLSPGETNTVGTPEFYWDLEVKRLASNFHPTEKPFAVARAFRDDMVADRKPLIQATATADAADFADALKVGEFKPTDPQAATQAHTAARTVLTNIAIAALPPIVPDTYSEGTTPTPTPSPTPTPPPVPQLPTEPDSEFADYDRGAFAFGTGHTPDAQKAWQDLLNRPAAERQYRSIWAAFMLGKLAMKAGKYPDAITWFQKTRQLYKDGFADSLGMAADSYGWEGRCEWKQGHPDKAAPLFLTQLALGDESAIVSLKALIPDREDNEGMLNFTPQHTAFGMDYNTPTPTPVPKDDAGQMTALQQCVKDPWLRRLETAHLLSVYSMNSDDQGAAYKTRVTRWLKLIQDAQLTHIEDAEYLGWIAYSMGDYPSAQNWLKLSSGTSPSAKWLDAKFQLRAGKMDQAIADLSQVIDRLQDDTYTNNWKAGSFLPANEGYIMHDEGEPDWSLFGPASGDLSAAHIAHGDYAQALDLFQKADMMEDASYVAERLLTLDELKTYVDQLPKPTPTPKPNSDNTADSTPNSVSRLRYLLGRRLVREDHYDEALAYLPDPYNKICAKYAAALKTGNDKTLPDVTRARALFTAAWIARYDGLEIMGTEGAPDSFSTEGEFQPSDIAAERVSGTYSVASGNSAAGQTVLSSVTDANGNTTQTFKSPLPATFEEIKRIKTNRIDPDLRWHYRYIAAGLAMRAAPLLEDNTEELADVVNTAGGWMKTLDEKKANSYYQVIDRRCSKTKIGKADEAVHWFVDQPGPWSSVEKATDDAMKPNADKQ